MGLFGDLLNGKVTLSGSREDYHRLTRGPDYDRINGSGSEGSQDDSSQASEYKRSSDESIDDRVADPDCSRCKGTGMIGGDTSYSTIQGSCDCYLYYKK